MAIRFEQHPGLVVYLTAGDVGLSPRRPAHSSAEGADLSCSREIALAAIDAGADVIELGVPFSDPLGDGPVIQRASEAKSTGSWKTRASEMCSRWRELHYAARPKAGFDHLFRHLNPILRLWSWPKGCRWPLLKRARMACY